MCKQHPKGQVSKAGVCYSCQNNLAYATSAFCRSRHKFAQAKYAAKRRGLKWTLSFKQWQSVVSRPCVYAIKRELHIRTGVDQRVAQRGYNLHNAQPCCARHNLIKSNVFTHRQMLDLVRRYSIRCGNKASQ